MQMVRRLGLLITVLFAAPAMLDAQTTSTPQDPATSTTTTTNEGRVQFGVVTFLQYDIELHEQDLYNAFDVTRGYLDLKARLSDRIRVRFTTDVRPTTDANLDNNLT